VARRLPAAQSPVIVDGDVVLAETGAIVDWIVERHGAGRLVPPVGTAERSRWTYWLHYAEGSAMPPLLMKLVFSRLPANAPFFLRPISKAIKWQAQKVYNVVKRVTAEMGVMFVDLCQDPANDSFVREPHRYYCPDLLHPSGEGYALWFAALLAQVPLARFLTDQAGSD
jgi:hypothetical protein